MYQAIGNLTGKVYAQGTKADCMRELQKQFPEYTKSVGTSEFRRQSRMVDRLYPEEIVIKRVGEQDADISRCSF